MLLCPLLEIFHASISMPGGLQGAVDRCSIYMVKGVSVVHLRGGWYEGGGCKQSTDALWLSLETAYILEEVDGISSTFSGNGHTGNAETGPPGSIFVLML